MSAKTLFKMGFLSMIAATGLFVASNGFATDAHTTTKFEGVKANSGTANGPVMECSVGSGEVQPHLPGPPEPPAASRYLPNLDTNNRRARFLFTSA